jgi:hypothetical protein
MSAKDSCRESPYPLLGWASLICMAADRYGTFDTGRDGTKEGAAADQSIAPDLL